MTTTATISERILNIISSESDTPLSELADTTRLLNDISDGFDQLNMLILIEQEFADAGFEIFMDVDEFNEETLTIQGLIDYVTEQIK